MRKVILTQQWTVTPVSTSCAYNDWSWDYRGWLPHWFEKHVIVALLWKRHKRHCVCNDRTDSKEKP